MEKGFAGGRGTNYKILAVIPSKQEGWPHVCLYHPAVNLLCRGFPGNECYLKGLFKWMGMYVNLLVFYPRILPPGVNAIRQLIVRQDDPIIENACYGV